MAVLFDTNILFTIARDPSREQTIRNKVNPDHEQEVISIVIVGELWSLVRQNGWGAKRLTDVETLLQKMVVIRVDSDLLVDRYVELDVFSQSKDPKLRLTGTDKSACNMGKNDFGGPPLRLRQRLLCSIYDLLQQMPILTIWKPIIYSLASSRNP